MGRRWWLIVPAVVLVAGGGWFAYQKMPAVSGGRLSETGAATPVSQTAGNEAEVIWASGKLVPAQWAALSPLVGGAVSAVRVVEGEMVPAGRLLVEIDSGLLQGQVQVAEAAMAEAEAGRAKLLAGSTAAELASAQADVDSAQGILAQAGAALSQSQAAAAVAAAQLAAAQAQYDELAGHPTPAERAAAQREVDLAQVATQSAQAAYDVIRGDPHAAALPEALALQQATVALEAAKAGYQVIAQGATARQLAAAQAQVEVARAQAQLAQTGIPSAQAAVLTAQAGLAKAQAGLDAARTGPTIHDIALAEARIASARAARTVAQLQVRQAQVVAPFAGQVGAVLVRPGEVAGPDRVVVYLGDTSRMRVETTDLRETDVTRVRPGQTVELTFDALPGRVFPGVIARVAPMSTTDKGSTNYTILVDLERPDAALRWGMTAFVNVKPQ